MGALSWVRIARRVPGLVRQSELPNLEAMLEAEADRQPYKNYFVLSCAIPTGIAVLGKASLFVAWLSGYSGTPLYFGAGVTLALAVGAWAVFFHLYRSVPHSKRRLRKLTIRLQKRYCSLANLMGDGSVLTMEFAKVLDEAAKIYLKHGSDSPTRAAHALDEAMEKLLDAAVSKEPRAQEQALAWATPMLDEMRELDRALDQHALLSKQDSIDDPLAGLREARSELQTISTAIQELHDHTDGGSV